MIKSLYDYDDVEIVATGQDYDFVAVVMNHNPQTIIVSDLQGILEDIEVQGEGCVGLLCDEEGREWLSRFENNEFRVYDEYEEVVK